MPVLMHISDLHRSSTEPVSNAELVAALERDLDRQSSESPAIPPPDALIVSGDLIKGARLNVTDPEGTVKAQYRQAEEFLGELAHVLFEGDRSRIVMCPGNHDVDWNQARASMERVAEDEIPTDLYGALNAPGSPFRWDWEGRALYRIADAAAYDKRMDPYWDFVTRFYADTDVLQLPTHNDEPLLVELFDRRVLVAAFNSCWSNDCFRRIGQIEPAAVARLHLDLKQRWEYDLRIAVWHHNTAGPPNAEDYMNVEQVRSFIDYGFRLGLHGHQHRSELVMHELGIPEHGTLAVLSAGSLAAGQAELPRGVNRQYNIVELYEDLGGARLHLREIEAGTFGPRRLNAFGGRSYSDITWQPAPSIVGTSIDRQRLNLNLTVNRAEAAYQAGDDKEVLVLLRPVIAILDDYGRGLLAEAAKRAKRWKVLVEDFCPPVRRSEISFVVEAATRLGKFDLARSTVHREGCDLGLPHPQQAELLDWISAEEFLG